MFTVLYSFKHAVVPSSFRCSAIGGPLRKKRKACTQFMLSKLITCVLYQMFGKRRVNLFRVATVLGRKFFSVTVQNCAAILIKIPATAVAPTVNVGD